LSLDADQDREALDDVCPVAVRLPGALGGLVSPPLVEAYTSNSESWPAGQPSFAVNVSRT